jgi:SAM-dependent methyltransferase
MPTPPIIDYEGSDYQGTFWDRGGREYEDQAEAIALKRLVPKQGGLLVEIGAGAGRNTPRYAGFSRIVLVDSSRSQLAEARRRLGRSDRLDFVVADAYRLPFARLSFDAATMIRTLHHMSDAPAALREVGAVLQSGGIFILEFANKRNLKSILRYWLGVQKWSPFTPEPIEFAHLNFDFQPASVRDSLALAGFKIDQTLAVSHFRLGLLKRLFPATLLAALDGFLQPIGRFWQFTPSIFIKAYRAERLERSAKN